MGWLGQLLLDPGRIVGQLGDRLAAVATGPALGVVVAAVVGALAVGAALRRARQRRVGTNAREITVLIPPKVDPAAATRFWAHLIGLLRPWWRRLLTGQPHISFEYRFTAEGGAVVCVWAPGSVPPGLVERAAEAAWPGARTRTRPVAEPPLPAPAPGERALPVGGELRLGRAERFPIRTDHAGLDLAGDLITAATDLTLGQAACVQILARPVTGHRVRRATGTGGPGVGVSILRDLLDLITPGPLAPAPQSSTRAGDRQAMLEASAANRAAAAKARGGHFETRIRYAVTTTLAPGTDPNAVRRARAAARGRAHALAAVFAAATDLNHYRRHRRVRLGAVLAERRLGRGDLLSVPELATLAALPVDATLPGVTRAGARALPPVPAIATTGPSVRPLGVSDTGGGRPVGVRVADARHHLYVLGSTGVGKSTLLAQLVLDDADHGRGVVVVDPKGDLVTDILDRLPASAAERVVLFDPDARGLRPPCVNPLDTGATDVDLAVDNLVTIFHRIYAQHWGPRSDDLLRACALTLCAQPGTATLADLPKLLTDDATRIRLTRTITDPVLRGFWDAYQALPEGSRAQLIGPLLNKVRAFLLRPFVKAALAAGPATIDMAAVLDQGGICLARLPKGSLGEDTTRLVGSLLVARTWHAATARTHTPAHQRPDAALVLDEAHNFLNLSTPVEDMLAEARGLRLSLTLAHQNLGQLPRELRDGISANARNKIIFTASPEDARDLARHTAPWLTEHDLTHLDAFHAAARLVTDGQQAPPCTLSTRPLPSPIPGRRRDIVAALRHSSAPATATTPTPPPARDPRRAA
ncbi:ATP-binding protein [Nocardia terpenica]